MTVESIVTNMWWIIIGGAFVSWFFGFVGGIIMGRLTKR